jgi:hypothetical protein
MPRRGVKQGHVVASRLAGSPGDQARIPWVYLTSCRHGGDAFLDEPVNVIAQRRCLLYEPGQPDSPPHGRAATSRIIPIRPGPSAFLYAVSSVGLRRVRLDG